MKLLPLAAVSALSLSAFGLPAHPAPQGLEPLPNILLIVLDDIGLEKLEWWPQMFTTQPTHLYPPTPTLENLRNSGIAFTNTWSSPVCSPSRAMILTGRNGHRTGIGQVIDHASDRGLHSEELLLPEVLPDAYVAGAFGKWHLSRFKTGLPPVHLVDYTHPVNNGFDEFIGHIANVKTAPSLVDLPDHSYNHFNWEKVVAVAGLPPATVTQVGSPGSPQNADWSATHTMNDARDWITNTSEPFFAYVAPNAPHHPIQVPPSGLVTPGVMPPNVTTGTDYSNDLRLAPRIFNGTIEALDTEIGNLLAGIPSGKLRNTWIFVVSDNGTPRRGALDGPYTPLDSSPCQGVGDCRMHLTRAPYNRAHAKNSVYQLGTRVPLIVARGSDYLDGTGSGSSSDALVSLVDLFRTIAEIAGTDFPLSSGLVDAGNLCNNPTGDAEDFFCVGGCPDQWTWDSVSFKHILDNDGAGLSNRSFALIEHYWRTANGPTKPVWCEPAQQFQRSITNGQHKLVVQQGFDAASHRHPCNFEVEFFNLARNPHELNCFQELCTNIQLGSPCSAVCSPDVSPTLCAMSSELDSLLNSGN